MSAGSRRQCTAATQDIVLVTNLPGTAAERWSVPVEVIMLLYRFRWLIELFFRWLKCVLSCRHLISESENDIQIQMYCALIAGLLIQLAGGDVKPDPWTYKLLCLYAQGWADEEEVLEHLRQRAAAAAKKKPTDPLRRSAATPRRSPSCCALAASIRPRSSPAATLVAPGERFPMSSPVTAALVPNRIGLAQQCP